MASFITRRGTNLISQPPGQFKCEIGTVGLFQSVCAVTAMAFGSFWSCAAFGINLLVRDLNPLSGAHFWYYLPTASFISFFLSSGDNQCKQKTMSIADVQSIAPGLQKICISTSLASLNHLAPLARLQPTHEEPTAFYQLSSVFDTRSLHRRSIEAQKRHSYNTIGIYYL
jgi:hypothetical protein